MKKPLLFLLSFVATVALGQIQIGQLPPATTPLSGTELTLIQQNGTTKQTAVSNIPSTFAGILTPLHGGTGVAGTLTGIPKANGTSNYTLAASADVTGLWTGTCNASSFLRGDGACAAATTAPAGSDTFIQYNAAGVFAAAADLAWSYTTDTLNIGTTALPPKIIPNAASGVNGAALTVQGGAAGATNVGGTLNLLGGVGGATSGNGGVVNVTGGASTVGNGGTVNITGGLGNGTNQNGGSLNIKSGNGVGTGGSGGITISTDIGGASGPSGGITIATGNANGTSTGNIRIQVGNGNTSNAGDLQLVGGTSANGLRGSNITATAGGSLAAIGGSINLTAGNSTGSFSAGNITLTGGTANTAGFFGGLHVLTGNTSADTAVIFQSQSGATTYGKILGDGGIAWGSAPTGGDLGPGTINATGLAINGASLSAVLSGTTGSIGGGSLANGACTSGTVAVTSSTTSMGVVATPATYPGDGFSWNGYVSAAGTVTVKVCNATGGTGTPTASTYNVRVLQ